MPKSETIDTVEVRGIDDGEVAKVIISEDPKPRFQGQPVGRRGQRRSILKTAAGEERIEDRSIVDGEEIWISANTGKRYKSVTLSILCK